MLAASRMGQVTVTLNGRTYSLWCADGEEARLLHLTGLVKQRAEALLEEFGQIGDDRVLLMTAIMMADEMTPLQPASISADSQVPLPADTLLWASKKGR